MPAKKSAAKALAKKTPAKTKDMKPKKDPKGGSSGVVSLGKVGTRY